MAWDGGKQLKTTVKNCKQLKTVGDGGGWPGTERTVGDGPSLGCVGKVPEKTGPDGTTECRPSSSLILTCRATLPKDTTGR